MRLSGAGHVAVFDRGGGSSPASPCAHKGGREINPRAPTRSSHLREFRERVTLADEAAMGRARLRPASGTERWGFKLALGLLGGVWRRLGFLGRCAAAAGCPYIRGGEPQFACAWKPRRWRRPRPSRAGG